MIPNTNKRKKISSPRRNTSQRNLVLKAVCTGNHLSAREIFTSVSKKTPMSFGTVYRNLQILVELGEINAIEADPNMVRYDRRRDHHHHLLCKKCRTVFDLPIPYDPEFNKTVQDESGFIIDSHSITFEGLCMNCQKK
jgi:Fur family peroxide stress response transcriptional regulator